MAIGNLVHFKGLFGELGGANARIDYINHFAQDQDFSFEKALGFLVMRQRMVGTARFLTEAGIDLAISEEVENFRNLEAAGYRRKGLFAERYIRVKSRSHFGLSSFISNKNHVSPDILCNRWLVKGRRFLEAWDYQNNKLIFDLIREVCGPELLYQPMANKKWDKSIVPDADQRLWEAMQAVDFGSANLTDADGQLYTMRQIPYAPANGWGLLDLPKVAPRKIPANVPQLNMLNTHTAFLSYFLESMLKSDDVWDLFDRYYIERIVSPDFVDFRKDGIDVVNMGIVASALIWKLGLESKPYVESKMAV